MRKALFYVLSIALLSLYALPSRAQDLTDLQGIQYKLDGALGQAFEKGSSAQLDSIITTLRKLQPQNNIVKQWLAYGLMNKSVYLLQTHSPEVSAVLKEGIALLEGMEKKNSEDYALLGCLQSLSTATLQGMQAGMMAGKATENATKARQLDSTNLRAWYVLGSLDFYTPAMYGGGKKAEEYLLKGLACKDQPIRNPYFPSWGRDRIYMLLIEISLKDDNKEQAAMLLQQAKKLFPHNPMWGKYEEKAR